MVLGCHLVVGDLQGGRENLCDGVTLRYYSVPFAVHSKGLSRVKWPFRFHLLAIYSSKFGD